MRTRALRLGVWIALVAVGLMAVSASAFAADQQAVDLLLKGIGHYEAGELGEAREAFEGVLALNPGSQTALAMSQKVEIILFIEMQDKKELAPTGEKLLELFNSAARKMKRDVDEINKLLVSFQSPDTNAYLKARVQLIGHGPYAVPHLLQFLTKQKPDNQRIVARTISALTAMHRDVSLPLIAALQSDDNILKTRVAGVLGQIGDARALPALLALGQDPGATPPVVEHACEAVRNITGKDPGEVGPAVRQYEKLVLEYLEQDPASVGYVFGQWADIWSWNGDAAALHDQLTYEMVPTYLYYQRQGAEFALDALELDSQDPNLKGLLVALMCRQLKLVERHGAATTDEEMRQDAQKRLASLSKRVPIVCRLADAPVVGEALLRTLAVEDGPASLYLVGILGTKAGAQSGEAAQALTTALNSTDKDVRCRASVEIVNLSPTGAIGDPEETMQVLAAALKYAATKSALVALNDLQLRNRLSAALNEQNVASVECTADAGAIHHALNVEPAVDVVFLSGNLPDDVFRAVHEKVKADARTRSLPLYVILDARKKAVDPAGYEGITRVLSPDDARAKALKPLLHAALAEAHSPLGEQKGNVVLLGAQVLQRVDPNTTTYPLEILEPSLMGALRGYGEPVAMAAVADLASFGSQRSLAPLADVVADAGSSPELKAAACHAIAVVSERTGEKLTEKVVGVLRKALVSDAQSVREAAGEPLGVSGISSEDILDLLSTYAP